jgi:hypothetical protein
MDIYGKQHLTNALNKPDEQSGNRSVVHIAMDKGNHQIIEYLIDMDCSFNLICGMDRSVVHYAARNDRVISFLYCMALGLDQEM